MGYGDEAMHVHSFSIRWRGIIGHNFWPLLLHGKSVARDGCEVDGSENWSKFVENRSSTNAASSVVDLY
jgi:hypothetical protein